MDHPESIVDNDVGLRACVTAETWRSEREIFPELVERLALDDAAWARISDASTTLIEGLRSNKKRSLIDQFLTEYGLSNDEGVQLMRLAEALSRTVDATTADELIRDKIMGRDWLHHVGSGHSLAISLSGRALHLTDKWLQWAQKPTTAPAKLLAKTGNAMLRRATRIAIKMLSSQFVFAQSLKTALRRAEKYGRNGYSFSFDMLGEAARTKADAQKYYRAYADALDAIADHARFDDPRKNHGISIKLSALHPRYEFAQARQAVPEIVAMLRPLAIKARAANVQITIDAEEAERLDISIDVLTALVAIPELKGWQGLGFVVQAYQRRALPLLDWLKDQAQILGAPLIIRLVKGAYWDSEIKRAQEMGLESYPVYTRKEMTDLSYLTCARKMLADPEYFIPQFATHNAHSIAAVQEMAAPDVEIEFQRLFGMGQQLHDSILSQPNVTSRIYAPVGTQKDLLSYLIRRLLENGANSSFVHKLAAADVNIEQLVLNPVAVIAGYEAVENQNIPMPRHYLGDERPGAAGWDLSHAQDHIRFAQGMKEAEVRDFDAGPIIDGVLIQNASKPIYNPAALTEIVGHCADGSPADVEAAINAADKAFAGWSGRPATERAALLEKAADLLEQRASIFHYLAIKEAGKTWSDAVDEVREAVDFCRYYAARAQDTSFKSRKPLGVAACISPWNFPLAIFLGQITAALAAGNCVIAKPAEQTPLIAAEAVRLLHDAGIDPAAINLITGDGAVVGEALISHPLIAAVCFTGSTATAKNIALRLAETGRPLTPLIAETGGINAMIVDSSALLEQTVDAVISSAFQSAGQRCSALRILCVQEDIADDFIALLSGAMEALYIGDPQFIKNDIGPVIDTAAKQNIEDHIKRLDKTARKIGCTPKEQLGDGYYVQPVAYELSKFSDLDREIFGPVLHVVRFSAHQKTEMIDKINASGYGLTLGIQSRIDHICDSMAAKAHVGNIYINRNQIGAVVGVQPFGGEGLSGTGPKAGGPLYLYRLSKSDQKTAMTSSAKATVKKVDYESSIESATKQIQNGIEAHRHWNDALNDTKLLSAIFDSSDPALKALFVRENLLKSQTLPAIDSLPSPAGETNDYALHGRGLIIFMLGNTDASLAACMRSLITGNGFLHVNGPSRFEELDWLGDKISQLTGIDGVVQQSTMDFESLLSLLQTAPFDALMVEPNHPHIKAIGSTLAARKGKILPILTPTSSYRRFVLEKTVTRNIAAAGGDVSLLNA